MKIKKFLKVFLILCIVLSLFTGFCFATEGEDEEISDEVSENVTNTSTNTSTSTSTSSSSYATQVSSVSTVSDMAEANLGLNNILNVLLIAVGFLLILFAIAILIRLKK